MRWNYGAGAARHYRACGPLMTRIEQTTADPHGIAF